MENNKPNTAATVLRAAFEKTACKINIHPPHELSTTNRVAALAPEGRDLINRLIDFNVSINVDTSVPIHERIYDLCSILDLRQSHPSFEHSRQLTYELSTIANASEEMPEKVHASVLVQLAANLVDTFITLYLSDEPYVIKLTERLNLLTRVAGLINLTTLAPGALIPIPFSDADKVYLQTLLPAYTYAHATSNKCDEILLSPIAARTLYIDLLLDIVLGIQIPLDSLVPVDTNLLTAIILRARLDGKDLLGHKLITTPEEKVVYAEQR